jgi:predicted RecA/RadA family phage recombinase
MATNFKYEGDKVTVLSPGTVTSGSGVLIGLLFGVALHDAVVNELLTLGVTGVWYLPKATGSALTAGTVVYWDATNSRVTTTATGNKVIGLVETAAASSDTKVAVLLTPNTNALGS